MSAREDLALPGTPGPALRDAYGALSRSRRAAFRDHLLGGTSADFLSDWMKRAGTPVGATSIKSYRRSLEGSV